MTKHRPLIEKAIALVGSQQQLADAVGLSQQGISYLLNEAPRVSAEVAVAIERATNGEISRADLRPDLFDQGGAA